MTEQIYYNMWGSQSEEHKDYFYTIGTIASWIGYALIGPRHTPYTTDIMPLSNISTSLQNSNQTLSSIRESNQGRHGLHNLHV